MLRMILPSSASFFFARSVDDQNTTINPFFLVTCRNEKLTMQSPSSSLPWQDAVGERVVELGPAVEERMNKMAALYGRFTGHAGDSSGPLEQSENQS